MNSNNDNTIIFSGEYTPQRRNSAYDEVDEVILPDNEPNFKMLEAYESMHFDELNHITFPSAEPKFVRQFAAAYDTSDETDSIFDKLQAGEDVGIDITYAPKKYKLTRQYHANEVYGCGRTGAEIMAQNQAREAIVQNLNGQFNEVAYNEVAYNEEEVAAYNDDLLINIKTAFPLLNLKDIAGQINRIYSNTETLESFVPGQRIGDYEYMTIETDYCIILFGRKTGGDNYATIHTWLK